MITVILFTSFGWIFCQDFDDDIYAGIWRSRFSDNTREDAFLAIEKIDKDSYFIIYVGPGGNHGLDYAEYGVINEENYLEVVVDDNAFYIESYGDILFHYWNIIYGPTARKFTRIAKSDFNNELSQEEKYENLNKFIESQQKK